MGMRGAAGWVGALVEESFFVGCEEHEGRKKKEKNIFCLCCCASICPHCATAAHRHHPLLQVRRYVYNDVVRLGDLEKLIDCSFVQPYTINSAKVIFLKPRPQSRPFKGSGNICLTCDRILQEPFHFCSLSCKVGHVMTQGGGDQLSNILYLPRRAADGGAGAGENLASCFPRLENLGVVDGSNLIDLDDDGGGGGCGGGQVTPNSILEAPLHHRHQLYRYDSASGSSNGSRNARRGGGGDDDASALFAGDVPSRKKKSTGGGGGFFPQIVLSSFSSRRKGAPHRSPFA